MKEKWKCLAAAVPSAGIALAEPESAAPVYWVQNPNLTMGLIVVIIAETLLIAALLAVLLFRLRAENSRDISAENEDKSRSFAGTNARSMIAQQVAYALRKYRSGSQARIVSEGETDVVLLRISEKETLKLEVVKQGRFYTLRSQKPPQTEIYAVVEKEGIHTDKLVMTKIRTGMVVQYDPDSIWAYLDLSYHSLTEEGVKDDMLEKFFVFDHIPPAPLAFDAKVLRRARLERKNAGFYLVEKGEVTVTEK